jgi:squalene-hopene/tetraprenyl-beta-curcumene cyclase
MLRRIVLPLVLAGLTAVAAPADARAQGANLESVIDDGLAELARRQQPNGSYENDVTATAQAILALAESPRKYTESDGPFMRKAVAWLASQVGPDGKPAGLDGGAAVGAAKWMHAALATTHSEVGKAATGKLATFLASPAGQPPAGKPADHLWTATVTAGKDAADAANSTDSLLGSLAAGRGTNPGDFDRLLEALPTVLVDVAARFPDLKLAARGAAPGAWAKAASASLLATLHAPAGFEEATPRNLANATRALSICAGKRPEGDDGESPKAPPLAGTPRKVESDLKAAYKEAATAGLAFLEAQQKNGRFGFMGHEDAGVTALALSAAIRTARRLEKPLPPWADVGLDWLVSLQKKNGAIHSGGLAVYTTSAAVMALADGARAKDLPVVQKAATFLRVAQLDEGEGYDKESDWGYGGIGYDGNELRADLSNTQFGMEALHAGGVPADDEAMQRAIVFLQRCQNNPEFNPKPFEREDGQIVKSGTDGGSGYAPGESKAGLIPNGDGTFTSRSYGSMTYALLKCYLFAGLKIDDPRVKAALNWIGAHWTVDLNPGFDPKSAPTAEYQGLFYYWFTMAKALDASGLSELTTADGVKHAWRDELLKKLLVTSMNEGFWTNKKSGRWMEEFPVLASSFALIAMDHCLGAKKAGQ